MEYSSVQTHWLGTSFRKIFSTGFRIQDFNLLSKNFCCNTISKMMGWSKQKNNKMIRKTSEINNIFSISQETSVFAQPFSDIVTHKRFCFLNLFTKKKLEIIKIANNYALKYSLKLVFLISINNKRFEPLWNSLTNKL